MSLTRMHAVQYVYMVNEFSKQSPSGEQIDILLNTKYMRIERIVSKGHISSKNFWYDQDENEWVMLLKGAAKLAFEDSNDIIELHAGDYVDIPAHRKHRVEWTTPNEESVWLTVFYRATPV